MLYPKNKSSRLSKELFEKPTAEYRGAPFWAWNNKLDREELLRQVDVLDEMGMGGFHIHCRTGLDTEYMGEEYLELVKDCDEKAKKKNMLCWLYDEDRWPSGYGGGLVTKELKYRGRYLVFTPKKQTEGYDPYELRKGSEHFVMQSHGGGKFLAKYDVLLDENGCLKSYRKLSDDEETENTWYAYMELESPCPWFNNQSYVNTLDKKAIERFIEVTHEPYYKKLGDEFGKSIPAIFTDEPQFTRKNQLNYAAEKSEMLMPYTDDFEETYQAVYGESLLDSLPEVFWELPDGKVSKTRYRYHDHVTERFAQAFSDTLGNWCRDHGIMLTGHVLKEETLQSQTTFVGEAMRMYRGFQYPGMDLLCDHKEYTTAKQVQSASHQYGREGVLSELYGVTNWDFDFRHHKLQGDWQAALGVTTRVHHLSLVSMEGEAKRDYPATINYQSPWYEKYSVIEDHFARLNTALTRGRAKVKVGVVHPIESYWLHFGPADQTAAIRKQMDENFKNITNWLLFGLIDFDFISESLLPELYEDRKNGKFNVGAMGYDVIVVPGCETLRSTTVEALKQWKKENGRIIFVGDTPKYVDAALSEEVNVLLNGSQVIPFEREKILESLEEYREVEVRITKIFEPATGNAPERHVTYPYNGVGERTSNLISQYREDEENNWLFLCSAVDTYNDRRPVDNYCQDNPVMQEVEIRIKGEFTPVIYDTMSGEIKDCYFVRENGMTKLYAELSYQDSLLICLKKKLEECAVKKPVHGAIDQKVRFDEKVLVTLSEPNVVLLDMAEYRFDGGEWQKKEEILRIDNNFRTLLGYPLRRASWAQPWTNKAASETKNRLDLRFVIESEIDVEEAVLALENAAATDIYLNGRLIDKKIDGYYVDLSIKKVVIGKIAKGENELILSIPFGEKTNVEWCYLLGDFGVRVSGTKAVITEPVRELNFGDITKQGLPFYAGNVTYHMTVDLKEEAEAVIRATIYRGHLLSVACDGKEAGNIVTSPYRLSLGNLKKGEHKIDLTVYGNRVNAFGAVHNCDPMTEWFGPDVWRSEDDRWSYEYQLKPTGVLISPIVDLYWK